MDVLFGNVALAPEQELAKENPKKQKKHINIWENYKTGRKNSIQKLGETYNSQEGQGDLKNLEDKILP